MPRYPSIILLALALNAGVAYSQECSYSLVGSLIYTPEEVFPPSHVSNYCSMYNGDFVLSFGSTVIKRPYPPGSKKAGFSAFVSGNFSATRVGSCGRDIYEQPISSSVSAFNNSSEIRIDYNFPEWSGCSQTWKLDDVSGLAIGVCTFFYTGVACSLPYWLCQGKL